VAVGVWNIAPSEFWRMSPQEFWVLEEQRRPPEKVGDFTVNEFEDMMAELHE
jgi:hypothetical protein